jgi:hypothetical protein
MTTLNRSWNTFGHYLVKAESLMDHGGGQGLLLAGVALTFYAALFQLAV